MNRTAVLNPNLHNNWAWQIFWKPWHQRTANLKGSLCEGVIDCFALFTLFLLLVSRQLEVIVCLPSEILCVFPREKTHSNNMRNDRCRAGGGEKRRRRRDWWKGEREKEEEWYGCADSLWPFSLLHQQHRGYLYIGVGCSAPLYKPVHTHAHMHTHIQGELPKVNAVFCSHYWLSSTCSLVFLALLLVFLLLHQLLLWVFHPHSSGRFLLTETVGRARNRNRSSSLACTGLSSRCLNTVPGLPGRGHGEHLMEMCCSHSQSVSITVNVKIKLSSIVSNSEKNTLSCQ